MNWSLDDLCELQADRHIIKLQSLNVCVLYITLIDTWRQFHVITVLYIQRSALIFPPFLFFLHFDFSLAAHFFQIFYVHPLSQCEVLLENMSALCFFSDLLNFSDLYFIIIWRLYRTRTSDTLFYVNISVFVVVVFFKFSFPALFWNCTLMCLILLFSSSCVFFLQSFPHLSFHLLAPPVPHPIISVIHVFVSLFCPRPSSSVSYFFVCVC